MITKAYYVYMLRCGDGSYYTGYTTDLERRLKKHQSGVAAKYTRSRLPVEMVQAWPFEDLTTALRIEWAIKQLTRPKKDRLLSLNLTSQEVVVKLLDNN